MDRQIHRLLIDPGIEPVNENVVEENSSSNHTAGGRSPVDRSQRNLRRLFTVHTTSSINEESARVSPNVGAAGGDDTSKSQKRSLLRWRESMHKSEREFESYSNKEAIYTSKEGSKLDLSFGEQKEATKGNIFGVGSEQDEPINTPSPSFHVESFFPEVITPKNAVRGRK